MLLLVACCYFWCCLCTTGNPSGRERVREKECEQPLPRLQPSTKGLLLLLLPHTVQSFFPSSLTPRPSFSAASSLLAVIFRALTLPTWHAIVMVQSFPQRPAVFPWLQLTAMDPLSSLLRLSYKFFWLLVFPFHSIFSCFCFFCSALWSWAQQKG